MEIGVPPIDDAPQVYMLKKTFDICDQYIDNEGPAEGEISGNEPLPGGSVPPSGIVGEGEEQSGCVDVIGDRLNEYLFTGEQMAVLVAVRDLNGAEDITGADLYVDNVERAMCNELSLAQLESDVIGECVLTPGQTGVCSGFLTKTACDAYPVECDWIPGYEWFGHDVTADLEAQPPAKSAGTDNGYDPAFDKLYQCVFTATPLDGDSGSAATVIVKAFDQMDNEGASVPDFVYLNPAITLDIVANPGDVITFPEGTPGQTVYSEQTLQIKNTAEGGVDLVAWMSGTDLFAADGAAKCPETNIIDVDEYMEYRCKIGTIFNNPWTKVPNPNDKESCTVEECQNAKPLLPDYLPLPSVLANMHTAECWFRFTYPTPICVGDFTEGGELRIYARAI
jgi:hypothetical protein